MTSWMTIDENGVRITTLYVNSKRRIAGKRYRECEKPKAQHEVGWTEPMKELLIDLLKKDSLRSAWKTIANRVGDGNIQCLKEVVEALLLNGVLKVHEELHLGEWTTSHIEFVDRDKAYRIAGLVPPTDLASAASLARAYQPKSAFTDGLLASLAQTRNELVLRRVRLIEALDRWVLQNRQGTRRDFALFATGNTKGVASADWVWLMNANTLEWAGIIDHQPTLLVAGNFFLSARGGCLISLAGTESQIGLSQSLLAREFDLKPPRRWIVFENRTVFDRASRINTLDSILWVPGYAPGWWISMVSCLVKAAPAPAILACDPDPAGIEIAFRAVTPWREASLDWEFAGMDAEALASISTRTPITQQDLSILKRTEGMIAGTPLERIWSDISQNREKGEQEGFWTDTRLASLLQETRA